MALVEKVADDLNQNKVSIATFLDLSNAFDCFDRGFLLQRLYENGIRGTPHDLVTSYLTHRRQYVVLSTQGIGTRGLERSDVTNIEQRVP